MPLERRDIRSSLSAPISKCWIGDNPFETHFLNTYTILIPEGEKFIIRSSRKFVDKLSQALRDEVKGLFYQEGQHSAHHAKLVKLLEEAGYTIEPYVAFANAVAYRFLERIEPDLSLLAVCSGVEHINACIAEFFLRADPLFDGASKDVARIFAWHFAEEIEHGCVVYDILKEVDSNYLLRTYGLLAAYLQFVPALYVGAMVLAFQDKSLFHAPFWKGMLGFSFSKGFARSSLASIGHYFRPSFHPIQTLKMELVRKGMDFYYATAENGDAAAAAKPATVPQA